MHAASKLKTNMENKQIKKLLKPNAFNIFVNEFSTPKIKPKLDERLANIDKEHAKLQSIQIRIASPDLIRQWASERAEATELIWRAPEYMYTGEVQNGNTVDYKISRPISGGLFCQIIFGPLKDWTCACKKPTMLTFLQKQARNIFGKRCKQCFVELTESRVRRYNMGVINLNIPVIHTWYLNGNPSYLTDALSHFSRRETSVKIIKDIIYYKNDNPTDFDHPLYKSYLKYISEYTCKPSGIGFIEFMLDDLDINLATIIKYHRLDALTKAESNRLTPINKTGLFQSQKVYFRRIRAFESFYSTKSKLAWMLLKALPVLPPTLRPMVELENGYLVTADVNEFYRVIINYNKEFGDYMGIRSSRFSFTPLSRLQQSVDKLIDNARTPGPRIINNVMLKSLTQTLEGKEGRFRLNLLGKRVDFSGRSVIVSGPSLKLYQCGLPYQMAMELFKPFLVNKLLKSSFFKNAYADIKLASNLIEKNRPFILLLLIELTKRYCILLNRAPTLHRFGVQAFSPIITTEQAIQLHPLVCTGFNADFDGDQMAVHLPLTDVTQMEADILMKPMANILSQSNGDTILKPTQDMVIGAHYLTMTLNKNHFASKKLFSSELEALSCYNKKVITIHHPILVRYSILNLIIEINPKRLKLMDKIYKIKNEKQITIYNILESAQNEKKCYLITNIGIFITKRIKSIYYNVRELFLETTPGRIIFNKALRESLNSDSFNKNILK